MDELGHLVEQAIRRYVRADADVVSVATLPMQKDERGYSGASLERLAVAFRAPGRQTETITLIVKEAPLVERRVLALLASQDQCVPFSHALDLASDRPALMCQQDLGAAPSNSTERQSPEHLEREVARCLARIHIANLGRAAELAWLPRADRSYVEGVILADYRAQLARAMERPAFAAELGDVARQMDEAAEPFLAATDRLWDEGDSLTLIHADMMDDHVLVHGGHPYLIDWGQARYGSFYLDLPNYFTPESVHYYREALAELGLDVPAAEFMRRYGEAGRYVGFKYIGYLLFLWTEGQLGSLHRPLLNQLLSNPDSSPRRHGGHGDNTGDGTYAGDGT